MFVPLPRKVRRSEIKITAWPSCCERPILDPMGFDLSWERFRNSE